MTHLVAAAQIDVALGNVAHNLDRMAERHREARRRGARLTIFPECAVTGYCFDSLDEARPFAESIPGPATEQLAALCRAEGGWLVAGMLEADGPRVFNAAVLVGPHGVVGTYRKVHLPFLGVDMFTTPGDRPFAVHDADGLRIGMTICYDAAFPEAARCLALLGADLIVLPTNWPPGAECTAACLVNARALENAVYYAAVNRVGTERGFRFIGESRIADPSGATIAHAAEACEQMLYAEIDAARSRNKHIVRIPGRHEIDRFADRRPEFYGLLAQPHALVPPGRRSVAKLSSEQT